MFQIAVLSGDGIGPEVTRQGVKVLRHVAQRSGLKVELREALIAGAAYDEVGSFCPDDTVELARSCDAVLFGASGAPGWQNVPPGVNRNPLLTLRKALSLYANLRPAWYIPALDAVSPLKPEIASQADVLVVRELSSGVYYGQPRGRIEVDGVHGARDTMLYMVPEIERVMRMAFELARLRRKSLTSVDKANVLETSKLWRETATRIAGEYPDVELTHLYVDVAAMELVRNPGRFDTMVTGNLFGDILTDEAAVLMGSLGMMPSASLGERGGLFEPIHGSAPDIAGQDRANPMGSILSVALMFDTIFQRRELGKLIVRAVENTLERYRTADVAAPGLPTIGCEAMGDRIVETLEGLELA